MAKRIPFNLSEKDLNYLKNLLSKGSLAVKTYRRATALLSLNEGASQTAVAQRVSVTKQTVCSWVKKYRESGLDFLQDKARSGRPKKIASVDEAKVTALACSNPPEGYSQWSLRLLADQAVELIEAESISYSSVNRILKKTNSSHTSNDSGSSAKSIATS